jgi:hypothetical protein
MGFETCQDVEARRKKNGVLAKTTIDDVIEKFKTFKIYF